MSVDVSTPFSRLVGPVRSLLVGAALVLSSSPAHAKPQGDGFEDAMARAGALVEKGEHASALADFEAAYASMPREIKIGNVGEFVAYSGGRSALRAFNTSGDRAVLERGKTLLATFVSDVDSASGAATASTDRALSMLAIIEGLLEPEPELAPEGATEPSEIADDEPLDQPDPAPAPQRPRRDAIGLGLTITGALATAGGLAAIIAGARQVAWYEDELERNGWSPDATHYDYDAKLDEARRVRNIDLGVGIGVTAVGIGLLTYGAIRLKNGGKPGDDRRARLPARPTFAVGRRSVGGSLTLRF